MWNLRNFKVKKKKFLFVTVLTIFVAVTLVFLINSSLKYSDFVKIPPNAKFSYILFGKKDGKDIYRTTILVRLKP